jgi:hypothetical protein
MQQSALCWLKESTKSDEISAHTSS